MIWFLFRLLRFVHILHLIECQVVLFFKKTGSYSPHNMGAHCVNRGCVALTLISKFRVI